MRIFRLNGIEISDKSDKYMLTNVSGNTSGGVRRTETTYVDTDGAEIDDVLFQYRVIDISGFISCLSNQELERRIRELNKAFNPKRKAVLEYFNGSRWYKANVIPDKLPDYVKINNYSCTFTAYLNMYEFYWMSYSDIQSNLFKRKDLINGTFTLPCVFTKRVDEADILNNGDAETFPKIKIQCVDDAPDEQIVIQNSTNGQKLTINYKMSIGEILEIDCYNHTIHSSISGNIIDKIKVDSDFISYEPGLNHITATGCGTSIISHHQNRYLGA